MRDRRFEGRRAIITGGSSGIGAAVAQKLLDEGARVAVAGRSAARLEALAARVGDSDRLRVVPTDLFDPRAPAGLVDEVATAFGGIDILVNSAGVNWRGPIARHSAERLASIVQLNLVAPIVLSRLVLPHLRSAGGGAIVNVASLAGRVPVLHEATYCATKFGLRAFSLALAEELAPEKIQVSVISPGPVDTGFIMNAMEEVPDLVFSQSMSTASGVADAILESMLAGPAERVVPRSAALGTQLMYLFPSLGRLVRPLLERRGRVAKQKFAARRAIA